MWLQAWLKKQTGRLYSNPLNDDNILYPMIVVLNPPIIAMAWLTLLCMTPLVSFVPAYSLIAQGFHDAIF